MFNNNSIKVWSDHTQPILSSNSFNYSAIFPIPETLTQFTCVYSLTTESSVVNGIRQIGAYNLGILDPHSGRYCEKSITTSDRLLLSDIISVVIEEFNHISTWNLKKLKYISICQLTHNGAIDWSLLKDRDNLKFFSDIHNTPIVAKAHCLSASINNEVMTVLFQAYDTSLHCEKTGTPITGLMPLTHSIVPNRMIIEYETNFLTLVKNILNYSFLPLTTSKLAEKAYKATFTELIRSKDTETDTNLYFDSFFAKKGCRGINAKGQIVTKKISMIDDSISQEIIRKSYSGGINCSYICGNYNAADKNEILLDIDLASAYPTALSSFNDGDFNKVKRYSFPDITIRSFEELPNRELFENINQLPYVFVNIDFKFDSDVQFPNIPVRHEEEDLGLIYCLEGHSFITGVELIAALKTNKVAVNIRDMVVVKATDETMMAEVFKVFINERYKHSKDSFQYNFYKFIANNIYGKMSQGINKKVVTDSNGKQTVIAPVSITCVPYVANATGLVRAVICELVNLFEQNGCRALNVTTDGLIISVPKPEGLKIETDETGKVINIQSIENYIDQRLLDQINELYSVKVFKNGFDRIFKDVLRQEVFGSQTYWG